MAELPTRDFAPLFSGAQSILETWGERRGYRLEQPKVAAVQALALSAANELFDECLPSRPGLSAAGLFLRFEGDGGARMFADTPEALPRVTRLICGETGEVLEEIRVEPVPANPAEEGKLEDALAALGQWRRICFGGNWDEVRERLFADFVGADAGTCARSVDPCTRMALRAVCQALLTLLRTEDDALQVQAAHTLLRMLKPRTPAGGGGGQRFIVNDGAGWKNLCMGGPPDVPRDDGFNPDDYDTMGQGAHASETPAAEAAAPLQQRNPHPGPLPKGEGTGSSARERERDRKRGRGRIREGTLHFGSPPSARLRVAAPGSSPRWRGERCRERPGVAFRAPRGPP